MKLPILKCHGSGNDFILINEYDAILFSEEERVRLSQAFCNRAGKLGADGLLFFQKSEKADGKMRMFNPDGSEAEMCGNGLRCIGRFACEKLNTESVSIETLKSVSQVIKDKPIYKGVETYQAELNTLSLNQKEIPILISSESLIDQPLPELATDFTFTAVSMPNPHLVSIVEKIDEKALQEIGEKANQLKTLFPSGVNVNFCQIIDEAAIYVRTYERGVGLTQSCGSGMSASALVYCLLGYYPFNKSCEVYNRGGLVKCEPTFTHQQYRVFLSGNATFMFSHIIEFELPKINPMLRYCDQIFIDEIQNYGRLLEYSESLKI
jgi:diaminopimelate epimerase